MSSENLIDKFKNISVPVDLSKKLIIGLTGVKTSGKSTISNCLVHHYSTVGIKASVVSCGYDIKRETAYRYNFDINLCYDEDKKDTAIITYVIDEELTPELIPESAEQVDVHTFQSTPRELMQCYSMYRRNENPTYWIELLLDRIKFAFTHDDIVIIDDIRMVDEAEFVRAFPNNTLFKINHWNDESPVIADATSKHPTETSVANIVADDDFYPKFGLFYLKHTAKHIAKHLLVSKFVDNTMF